MNVVTMVITAAVVMMFVSVLSGLLSFIQTSGSAGGKLTRIVVVPKMVIGGAPVAMATQLQAIDGVQVVQRFRVIGGRHASGATFIVVGEEDSGLELNTEFFPVEPAVIEAWKQTKPMGAVVSDVTARDLRLVVGQEAEIPTSAGPLRVKVVGLSHNALVGQRIAVHYEYLMEFLKNPGTCLFRVFSKPDDFEKVARAINETTMNSPMPMQGVNGSEYSAMLAKRAGMVPLVLGFLGMFLVLVTALTLANNCAIAIRERRTETATMRVVGYHRATIVRLLLSEAVLVGLVGGVISIVLCYMLFRNGVQLTPGEAQLLPPVTLGAPGIVAGIAVAIVVPLIGALPSAVASVRTPLVQALRDTA
jgi:putative ABC transport system permease protein